MRKDHMTKVAPNLSCEEDNPSRLMSVHMFNNHNSFTINDDNDDTTDAPSTSRYTKSSATKVMNTPDGQLGKPGLANTNDSSNSAQTWSNWAISGYLSMRLTNVVNEVREGDTSPSADIDSGTNSDEGGTKGIDADTQPMIGRKGHATGISARLNVLNTGNYINSAWV
ncbi:hypothetical protein BJ085DRAFT_32330 [Dimargaris cristalligena]|uniref:Uncharacterized protein n=1 Tax=Dimargaris cristalligena TaxID=215637 RepID=A0A4P9ZSH1_9FUNG|nr:hypothetical protein BJ085DRAFT_32330 [Dimargaris cristalligena]|eukprot:RKP36516.1 hypothetical protein BJ085DRAFT_32330 [Dimargaris cristalligena]